MNRLVNDELDLLTELVPLQDARIIELGCGAAALARSLLERFERASVTGLEVDARQHAKNLAAPRERLAFVAAGAQAIPFANASFDVALMLKSLHHIPTGLMAQGLAEARRVLRPAGYLYVSEPVFAGEFNEVVRLFNDEEVVRRQAQAALDDALRSGGWKQLADVHFDTPVHFRDFDDFERRMMHATYREDRSDEALVSRVRAAFAPHAGPDGAHFCRPMHVRLLQRTV